MPGGDTAFLAHDCFTLRNADAFYSLDWVQPVVHPYSLRGPLKDCPGYHFWSVFPTRQWSEIEDYIKIYAISGDNYHPLDTDKRLPKEHRQLTICAECGRQAHDCWAMGSMVDLNPPFDQPSYVACVYSSTFRALVAFMDTNVKWYDALQLRVSLCLRTSLMLAHTFLYLLTCLPIQNSCLIHSVLLSALGCKWNAACTSSLCATGVTC